MPTDAENTSAQTPATPEATPTTPVAPAAPATPATDDGGVPDWVKDPVAAYAEIQKVREEAKLTRAQLASIEAERKKASDAAAAAELKKLEDDKQYQELADKYKKEADALKVKAAEAELTALRVKVAADAGIPAGMAARLVGTTEGELKADAEGLKALLAPAAQTSTRTGNSSTPAPRGNPQGETDEQRRTRLFGRGANNPIFEKKRGG